jgi:choline dehydrogenase-like flavoprotein
MLETIRTTTIESARSKHRHDAVVIGSGATGGLAASLLAEAGMRVLVLDAGTRESSLTWSIRDFVHRAGYRILGSAAPYVLESILSNFVGQKVIAPRQPIQSQCYAWAMAPSQFVDDFRCPYTSPPESPFTWLRARQLGGRMVIPNHGRQYYRLSPQDIAPRDKLNPDWPLPYAELEPWYNQVERRLGLSGSAEDIPWFPMPFKQYPLDLKPAESELKRRIKSRWPNSRPVLCSSAPPMDCLEAAAATGNLSVRVGAVAREIDVDGSGHVAGVVWIDHKSKTEIRTSVD